MAEIADEDLMIMFQNGNVQAFDCLFEKYRTPVFNFIYRMLNRQRDSAEDLLQEIFVKIFKAKDLYQPQAKFSTWLFSITRNHCLNFLKSQRYLQGISAISLDAHDETGGLNPAEKLLAKQENQENSNKRNQEDLSEILEQTISAIPDNYKEIFLLHAVEGYSHEQIAGILEMKPATVRMHYHRAKLMLREKIGHVLLT